MVKEAVIRQVKNMSMSCDRVGNSLLARFSTEGASDICLHIPSTSTPHIQEGHEVLGHTLCTIIEAEMFPR